MYMIKPNYQLSKVTIELPHSLLRIHKTHLLLFTLWKLHDLLILKLNIHNVSKATKLNKVNQVDISKFLILRDLPILIQISK